MKKRNLWIIIDYWIPKFVIIWFCLFLQNFLYLLLFFRHLQIIMVVIDRVLIGCILFSRTNEKKTISRNEKIFEHAYGQKHFLFCWIRIPKTSYPTSESPNQTTKKERDWKKHDFVVELQNRFFQSLLFLLFPQPRTSFTVFQIA